MALAVDTTRAPEAPAPVRPPRALDFVRLKLRLQRNSFRGQVWRIVATILGLVFGLWMAVFAALGLAASGLATRDVGFVVASFAGTAVTVGWTLIPLLFFGIDETLDPARFALLPVPPRVLTRGMLAAAFAGVPALVTLLASSGLGFAAMHRFGVLVGAVALAGVIAGLVFGVVASRALTSAFAALLRSRRVRDLAAVIIAVLASSVAPLQWVIMSAVERGDIAQAVSIAEVLGWTPFAAPYVLVYDLDEHQWLAAAARLAITLGAIALLRWWWSRTIESAMLGVTSGGQVKHTRSGGAAVDSLIPGGLRRVVRPAVFGAIVARESRFWWRDARRRASLVSILMASAVLPIALNFASAGGALSRGSGLGPMGFGFAVTMAGTMGGMLLANQFAFDGNAYAAHLLAHVPGRTELRARAMAVALVAVPVQVVVVLAVALLANGLDRLPTGLGLLAASFGAAVASAAVLSVLAPYALPDSSNPFAVNSGGASAKGMLALVAMVGTLVICAPVVVAAVLFDGVAGGPWIVLALGLGYGAGAAWLGTYIAGDILDRRGPEVLIAVTPRR